MSPDLEQRFEQLAQLISSVSESLHREMHDGFRQVTQRFDLMETRLNRDGSLLQSELDGDKAIADLEERIRKLEQKRNGHS